jgi:hypothetical protein
MKRALVVVLILTACASRPALKAPDESHRVPVNRVMPLEATPDGGPEPERRERREGREVEWR